MTREYRKGNGVVRALDNLNLTIEHNEFIVCKGPSGCGKTTLLMTLAGMLHPNAGQVIFNGNDLYADSPREMVSLRALNIGFVFQMFHLISYMTLMQNVMLSKGLTGKQNAEKRQAAEGILERLGMIDRASHRPSELSAGEKQRAAIARAMVGQPKVILADEPTGNLDEKNAQRALEHLAEFHEAGGVVILVTHGSLAEDFSTRLIQMEAGEIVSNGLTSV